MSALPYSMSNMSKLEMLHCMLASRQLFPITDVLKETHLIPRFVLEIVIVTANFYAKV